MSSNELKQAVLAGDEMTFSHGGREYLLYGWDQCDGFVLSLECEGELVWQSAPMTKAACAEELVRYYSGI
ncbi:MAG: hypothetical protein IJK31_05870 [Ruminococcus sp.]|nr:hypothetical protein [Ruminococcus sp.]HRR77919.1 hypothetical protein [Ruminococcus sp.]